MRRLLIAITALGLALPAPALGAQRWEQLIVDACRDEKVDRRYSQADYRRALAALSADSDQYTACREVLNRARLAQLGGGGGGGGSGGAGAGAGAGANPATGSASAAVDVLATATPAERKAVAKAVQAGSKPVRVGGQVVTPGAVGLGAAAGAGNDLPTPVVVLLAVLGAVALGAAGAATWVRVRARRAG